MVFAEWSRAVRRTVRVAAFEVRLSMLWLAARLWRRLLTGTTFIAITGSVGKTTAKECLAAVLASRFPVAKSQRNQNERFSLPHTILRVRPWHRVAVIEVGTGGPGQMRPLARLVRPDVAVVLSLARTHARAFPALEDTAAEKAELIKALAPAGLAILNGDHPLVRPMAALAGRVLTFGESATCDVRGSDITAAWPAGLALTVHAGGESRRVQTRLVGAHWTNSVLAALTAALAVGIGLEDAVGALERVEPFAGRMQPIRHPSGAVVIRDEVGNAPPAIEAGLRMLAAARAERKVLVIGAPSDVPGSSRHRMRELAASASAVADLVVFVSRDHGTDAVKAAVTAGMRPGTAVAFGDLRAAAAFLRSELREGDVVLIKGRTTEHLSRIVFAQFGSVGCWKEACRKRVLCDFCPELRAAYGSLPLAPIAAAEPHDARC